MCLDIEVQEVPAPMRAHARVPPPKQALVHTPTHTPAHGRAPVILASGWI